MAEPFLSVVIAAGPNLEGLADCLEALDTQDDGSTEFLVSSTIRPSRHLVDRFPKVCWCEAAPDSHIPHLWGFGMARARGEVIAITTAHFRPAPDWVQAIRSAHARWHRPAIGGRIEPPRGGGAVSWAIYLLRYSTYLTYQGEQAVPDVAGDNASYKRGAWQALPDLARDGFWEQELHRRLCAERQGPVFVPAIRVTQRHAFGFCSFLCQRFRHGKQFGRARAHRWGAALRLVAIAASPLIPILFLVKIVVRVLRSGQYLGPFLLALPALLCFLLAWSAGEACGYLSAVGRGSPSRPPSGSEPLLPSASVSQRGQTPAPQGV